MAQEQVHKTRTKQSTQEKAALPTPYSHRNQVERARRAAQRRARTGKEYER